MVMLTDKACNPKRGQTDSNKSGSADILRAAAVAVAAINTAAAIKMADLQWEIAKDYLDIAKSWRNYYNNTYKPGEDQELAEAWALQPHPLHFETAIGRARATARFQFRDQLDRVIQGTSQYCVGLREALLKDMVNAEAQALAAISGLGQRNEQAHKDALDDVRWKKREQVLNRGRNMIADNITYSNMAAGIFGDLGAQAAKGAGGAMHYLGYTGTRRDTEYPTTLYMGQREQYAGMGYREPAPSFAGNVTTSPEPISFSATFSGGGQRGAGNVTTDWGT